MRISVFTPSHRPVYLEECFQSLLAQTFEDWEWVVVLNTGAPSWKPSIDDPRVRVMRTQSGHKVGLTKGVACELCTGEILVELDHDDILAPRCLEEIVKAFDEHPEASLVFSDFAQVNEDGSPNHDKFNLNNGWQYSDVTIGTTTYLRCHAMTGSPHNVGYIWYAPNHVRAFRRSAYQEVGGYDADLAVLDDQELMSRLFLVGSFHHIPQCLYLQRIHERNTQKESATNAFIQEQTVKYYDDRIEGLVKAWASREGLAKIMVRTAHSPGADSSLDMIEIDANDPRLPFEDNSVGMIKAAEVLQRIPNRAAFFNECYRVLAHGGFIFTQTPSTDGRGAFQDPSHVAFYNENSFWYLTQARLRELSLPELTARLQISRTHTSYQNEYDQANFIAYVFVNLMAIKDGPRQGGPLLC